MGNVKKMGYLGLASPARCGGTRTNQMTSSMKAYFVSYIGCGSRSSWSARACQDGLQLARFFPLFFCLLPSQLFFKFTFFPSSRPKKKKVIFRPDDLPCPALPCPALPC